MQQQILTGILRSAGITSDDQVQILTEKDVSFGSRHRHVQVAAVGHKIVTAARALVQEKLRGSIEAARLQVPADLTDQAMILQAINQNEAVEYWSSAWERLQGEDNSHYKVWQYVFVDSDTPNAFVTELLPCRFFITTGILKVAETPDELAVVLGHEISHLILGHISERNQVEVFLRTVEILLLSLDPSEGALSLLVVAGLAGLRQALTAAHSREHEREADELGLQLAARACFDTQSGVDVMYKMHQMSVSAASGDATKDTPVSMKLLDTHPPSLQRWELLKKQSETENFTKYRDAQCAGVSTRLFRAFWGSSAAAARVAQAHT
jgi:Zn-dependent protease with chaperone function